MFILICVCFIHVETKPAQNVLWCTISKEEEAKCLLWAENFLSLGLSPVVQCIPGGTVDNCVALVEKGDVDAVTVDGGQMFQHRNKVKPVMAEDYGNGKHDIYNIFNTTVIFCNRLKCCHMFFVSVLFSSYIT